MDFEKEWLLHFAKNIPKSFLKKRVVGEGNFLWHIFTDPNVYKSQFAELILPYFRVHSLLMHAVYCKK